MADQRTIVKQLAGTQDLLLGPGDSVTQTRNNQAISVQKIDLVAPVASVAALAALDTDKYTKAQLANFYSDVEGGGGYFYWDASGDLWQTLRSARES